METKISILFYVKRAQLNVLGLVPIYLRVTVGAQRINMATKRYTAPDKWQVGAQKMKPGSEEAHSVNKYLDALKRQVYDYQTELIQNGIPVNADNMKNKLNGTEIGRFSLVKIFQDHNNQIKALVGKEFAPGTLERYTTSLKHTVDFIRWKYNVSDIDIRSINHAFITNYEFYLRSERNCANNSAVKYIKNFGKIIRICLANGWLDKNPFLNYKSKIKEVERVFLTEVELQMVIDKELRALRLIQIQDIFVFCCFTGLAYADVKKLDKSQIVLGIDGEKKLVVSRQKTDTRSVIPLLPIPLAILDKYANDPQCLNTGKLLPVLSNQKVNEYVKELIALCDIDKNVTFHTARHTFATTVTLTNGVPIESVSKMLGHKDLKITQHYAKTLDSKVTNDMQILKNKFKTNNTQQEKTGS